MAVNPIEMRDFLGTTDQRVSCARDVDGRHKDKSLRSAISRARETLVRGADGAVRDLHAHVVLTLPPDGKPTCRLRTRDQPDRSTNRR